ncbi:low molecular weight phosphotyrosine protein phosphatase [Halomonas sp. MCCC 1A17488]|uniref:protein-tyrosine-phosphatase n=1 Tax=Billgrantia sulfidoxydans TaxID=2733484 RepID=A0ABX7W6F4_9GAMM|nr:MULTISPECIES: low molecular weight protein-tyrosine-phosphatase [Halomonas]MCE8015674.1 low molecular weight phosphotyrosine protein phosphatase [Halomonas sp. MCCC 1A17488]MCG3239007.1 low molecular weight phosphotyrosine protein phosphatase [Halomonas sp. MCCC 1A17488]QPP51042.1 low molecular weight phosphotyrosine protein phosphatase [Halomonas sp. SS10-MC5]QTP54554.1 low molecular weight phosphotyrosine protein phosphatase [Halomonas sulfidoxydans]
MRVLFVCLGNICRSPTAEGVFRRELEAAGLAHRVEVDSCGIGDWHVGRAPDPRSADAARRRGIDLSELRARQLAADDFTRFDYLLAMDHDNLAALRAQCPGGCRAHIGLFLDFAGHIDRAVPDPYYGGEGGFEEVLDLIESASRGLVEEIASRLEGQRP